MAKIRTEPVSLNETTLETNIIGEIKSLFGLPHGHNYPTRLRYLWDIPTDLTQVITRKVKAYRLTPAEEYHGGGWDSKIVIPQGNGNKKAFFIQFKAGKHKEGNTIKKSLFNIEHKNPNRHAEFTFNDNSGNNQHQTLKNLHDELTKKGWPSKSVMYGFPRVTDMKVFDDLEEDLILHTTFLSLSEMDAKAKANGANLYDGKIHHFRTCYFDELRREISSEPFKLDNPDNSSGLLFEILLTAFSDWRRMYGKRYPSEILDQEFFLEIAHYLKINPFDLYKFDRYIYRPDGENELKKYFQKLENKQIEKLREMHQHSGENRIGFEWRRDLFNSITTFINEMPDEIEKIEERIPKEYSFVLPEQEVELKAESGYIYNLLVF